MAHEPLTKDLTSPTAPPLTMPRSIAFHAMDHSNLKETNLIGAGGISDTSTMPYHNHLHHAPPQTYELTSKKCKHKFSMNLMLLSVIILTIFCCVITGLEVFRILHSSDTQSEIDQLKTHTSKLKSEIEELKTQLNTLQSRTDELSKADGEQLDRFNGSNLADGRSLVFHNAQLYPLHSNTFNSTTDKEYFDENEENDYDDEDEDDDEIYDDDEDALIDKVERLNVEHLNRDIKKQPLDQLDKLLFINDSRSDFVRNTRSTLASDDDVVSSDDPTVISGGASVANKGWLKKTNKHSELNENQDKSIARRKHASRHKHGSKPHKSENLTHKNVGKTGTMFDSANDSHHSNTKDAESENRLFSNGNVQNRNQAKSRRRVLHATIRSVNSNRAIRSSPHPGHAKLVAVHYQGDTSKYETTNARYEGNGRIRHHSGVYYDWLQSNWMDNYAVDNHFTLNNGVATVREQGLYYIYAQIFYHDVHDMNGYVIELNSEPLFQCTTTTISTEHKTKSNTCHTSGISYLNSGDRIHIKDLGSHRYALFDAAKSFFGLVRLGDLRALTSSGSGRNA